MPVAQSAVRYESAKYLQFSMTSKAARMGPAWVGLRPMNGRECRSRLRDSAVIRPLASTIDGCDGNMVPD